MDRQRREDELKNRGSKRAVDAEQSSLNRVFVHSCLYQNMYIVFVDLIFISVALFQSKKYVSVQYFYVLCFSLGN